MKLIIPLITLVTYFATTLNVSASLFSKEMEDGEWISNGSPFLCTLEQEITDFGAIQFIKRPKSKTQVRFVPQGDVVISELMMVRSTSDLKLNSSAEPTPYTHGKPSNFEYFTFDDVSHEFLNAVKTGDRLVVKRQSNEHAQFAIYNSLYGNRAVTQFKRCIEDMSPLSWRDAKFSQFEFSNNQTVLDESQQRRVANLLAYLPFDPAVNKVMVDGHSDDAGSNLANRMLSQERADEVAASLLEQGLNRDFLEVRAHGNRYPRRENNQSLSNKRVTIRLVKKIN